METEEGEPADAAASEIAVQDGYLAADAGGTRTGGECDQRHYSAGDQCHGILSSRWPHWDIVNESQMALTSGEKMDLVNIFVCGSGMDSVSNYTSKNMILPLNDLVEKYGSDIKSTLGELLSIGYQGDQLYAIPSNTTMGGDYGFLIRKDYLDQAGITVDESRVYTPEEAEETLLALKEHFGEGYYGDRIVRK